MASGPWTNAWQVFFLFAVPVGGGIPAGVVLGQARGLSWISMAALYFLSDVALALVFEPLMLAINRLTLHSRFLLLLRSHLKNTTEHTLRRYGPSPGPLTLILIAFGVDPMTGRAAALAKGHGFFTGWAVAIAGDMIFFLLIMSSTIWLNGLLGDGTWTAVVIMAAMIVLPMLFRQRKERSRARANIYT